MRVKIIILMVFLLSVMYLSADGVEPQGIGTEDEPYLLDSLDNLLWISTNADSWESYFVQVADIDASATQDWNEGAGFSPIGWWVSQEDIQAFRGSYIGNCFVIEGLYINRPETDAGGMFGYTIAAILDGIKLVDAVICGDNYVGGLAGYTIGTLISNCSVEGDVSGDWSVGGLVGYNYSSEITDCYAAVNVTGGEYVGGLTGNNALDSEITGCYTIGNVTGSELVGGLVGYNVRAVIINSYTTASVNGDFGVGGLVGDNDESTIANCYASGSVTGEIDTGGLVGFNNSDISSSIWNIESSSQLEGIGNNEGGTITDVLGRTTAEMQEIETYTDIGWDFEGETTNGTEEIWDIGEGLNDGFAYITALEWTIVENGLYAWFIADKQILELDRTLELNLGGK